MPKISIILPVYKVEKYIEDCAKSISNQSFSDFEVIIVDDGSPDLSVKKAVEIFEFSDIDFKVVKRDNGGLSAARNTGVLNASGEYYVFVDSDDVISDKYLETLYQDIRDNHCELSIAYFRKVKDDDKFKFDNSLSRGRVVEKKEFLLSILRHKVIAYFGCFMISRKLYDELRLSFDESVFFGVDQCIMWRLMVLTDKYSFNRKEVYNYYIRPESIMTGQKLEKMISNLSAFRECAEELRNNPYFDSNYIVTRQKVAGLHTTARRFGFIDFKRAYLEYCPSTKELMKYPDARIKMLGCMNILGKRMLYYVLKLI